MVRTMLAFAIRLWLIVGIVATSGSFALAQPPAEQPSAARAVLTSAVVDREPVDSVLSLSNAETRLFYFTEIRNMSGRAVVHVWEWEGQIMAEVEFNIGSPRWRVWSSKSLLPGWTGEWRVYVKADSGEILAENKFEYVAEEQIGAASVSN